jgi:hypothetical protein
MTKGEDREGVGVGGGRGKGKRWRRDTASFYLARLARLLESE